MLCGSGKTNEVREWYPVHPIFTVETLPTPLNLWLWAKLCSCIWNHKHCFLTAFASEAERSLLPCVRGLLTSLWSPSAPVAWHQPSPSLLTGLGIFCNTIVLDRIGHVLTLMRSSLLNLDSWLLWAGVTHGDEHVSRKKCAPNERKQPICRALEILFECLQLVSLIGSTCQNFKSTSTLTSPGSERSGSITPALFWDSGTYRKGRRIYEAGTSQSDPSITCCFSMVMQGQKTQQRCWDLFLSACFLNPVGMQRYSQSSWEK